MMLDKITLRKKTSEQIQRALTAAQEEGVGDEHRARVGRAGEGWGPRPWGWRPCPPLPGGWGRAH